MAFMLLEGNRTTQGTNGDFTPYGDVGKQLSNPVEETEMIKIILVVLATTNTPHSSDVYQTTRQVNSINECHNIMTVMKRMAKMKTKGTNVTIDLEYECVPVRL